MNLSLIKDYFTCQANLEDQRINKIRSLLTAFPRINIFSFYKLITLASVPQLNAFNLKKYLSHYSSSLQIVEPNQINQSSPSKELGNKKLHSEDEILQRGANLFVKVWGNNLKQFSFSEFAKFMNQKDCNPQKAQQVPFTAKKKLFEVFQTQIQGLLNIQTLRQICIKQYNNIADLFQTLADNQTNQVNKKSVKNLYLMHSQRMDEQFFNYVESRLSLPMNFESFLQLFRKDAKETNIKVKQRKIYFSSARRKKDQLDYIDQDNNSNISNSKASFHYQTPKTHKVQRGGMTSTKLTKGEKITELKQASVNISRFNLSQTPSKSEQSYEQYQPYHPKQLQILGQILTLQQSFVQLKRQLCYRKDFDLQLVYERQGHKFEVLLNQLYGNCNFTSFVRFILPQDYEHRYLTFIRHQTSNILSNQTIQVIDCLLDEYNHKQSLISSLWQKIDKQMIFRMYCNPCDQAIKGSQFNKYFTQRQTNLLLERMDPLRTGEISYDCFR